MEAIRKVLHKLSGRGKATGTPIRISDATTEEKRIIEILGRVKVVTLAEAADVWKQEVPEAPAIPFSEAGLRQCAEENNDGEDWRLVYILGLSLKAQRKIQGVSSRDVVSGLRFAQGGYWRNPKDDYWTTQPKESGYRLLNMKPLKAPHGGWTWAEQQEIIDDLGPQYERADETIVSETVFSLGKSKDSVFCLNHWGKTVNSLDRHVVLEFNIFHGMSIWGMAKSDERYRFGAVVERRA